MIVPSDPRVILVSPCSCRCHDAPDGMVKHFKPCCVYSGMTRDQIKLAEVDRLAKDRP